MHFINCLNRSKKREKVLNLKVMILLNFRGIELH